MEKRYRLKRKYPGLPHDWVAGMEVGTGDHNSHYKPCSAEYIYKAIVPHDIQNNPEYWELVKEPEQQLYRILKFKENQASGINRMFSLQPNGEYNASGMYNTWTAKEMLGSSESVKSGHWLIWQVEIMNTHEIYTVGDKVEQGVIQKFKIDSVHDMLYQIVPDVSYTIDRWKHAKEEQIWEIQTFSDCRYPKIAEWWRCEDDTYRGRQNKVIFGKGETLHSMLHERKCVDNKEWLIHSVKRLTDQVEFQIGQMVTAPTTHWKEPMEVTGIEINQYDHYLIKTVQFNKNGIRLEKVEKSINVYTTTDGAQIYDEVSAKKWLSNRTASAKQEQLIPVMLTQKQIEQLKKLLK